MFYIFYVKILNHLKNDSFIFHNYLLYFTFIHWKKSLKIYILLTSSSMSFQNVSDNFLVKNLVKFNNYI